MSNFESTKRIELGSCAFRQWKADSHCAFLHGYQLVAKLTFGCSSLDSRNWCQDFGGLKELKNKLRSQFDHTTIVAANDPALQAFVELAKREVLQLRVMDDGVGIERVAEWVFRVANEFIKKESEGRCWVENVEVFEHEDNSAIYNRRSSVESYSLSLDEPTLAETSEPGKDITANDPTGPGEGEVADEPEPAPEPAPVKHPANIGNKVTPGKGNWFEGTTWG